MLSNYHPLFFRRGKSDTAEKMIGAIELFCFHFV